MGWSPHAARFHQSTTWRGVGVELDESAIASQEPMPPAFLHALGLVKLAMQARGREIREIIDDIV